MYQVGNVDTNSDTSGVYHYRVDIFKEKSQQGEFKYSVFQKLLSLAHGNADLKQSFSANKKTVTPDRSSLSKLHALRSVKYHV